MSAASIPSVLLALTALFFATPTLAQQRGTLALRVIAHVTGEPLPGVQVRLPTQRLGGVTDPAGQVRVTGIRAGSHVVEIERIGYQSERLMIEFAAGQMVEGEVELTPRAVELEQLVAVAPSGNAILQATGFYDRRKFGAGNFLTRDEIDARAKHSLQLSSLMRRLPGVRLVPAGNTGHRVKSTRSLGRNCYAQVLLDGQAITGDYLHVFRGGSRSAQPPTFTGVNIDDLIALPDIEAIEWYSGPAGLPAQFATTGSASSDPACGTLVIWTRKSS